MMLFSIRPQYVDLILAGEKTVELRRRRPNLTSGDQIGIYSTAPRMQIEAVAVVADIMTLPVEELWALAGAAAGIEQAAFDRYFSGTTTGTGIRLAEVRRLETPLDLAAMRTRWAGWRPPQSFHRLPIDQERLVTANQSRNLSSILAA